MDFNAEKSVREILESYEKYPVINGVNAESILNKDKLISVTERIRGVLFPGFFYKNKIMPSYLSFILGEEIEYIHYTLKSQIEKALQSGTKEEIKEKAEKTALEFIGKIPKLREVLNTDVQAAFNGDPAAYSTDEIIFSYPGLYAITIYRIAHELHIQKVPMIPRIMTEYAHSITGIDIHPGATIGNYFFIDHGTGIVVGETTEIGNNVKIYQGVTLGALSTRKGQMLKGVKRHPTIGNNVTIYSGTTILGGETVIGDGAVIGGNAFIVDSVAPNSKVSIKNPELQISNGEHHDSDNEKYFDWMI